MTVYFIGAGPGAADLLTVRAQRLIRRCGTCLYAGSIVPPEVLALCPPISRIVNTARMPLAEIVTELRDAHERGDDVARLHSGDPSLYSALTEQLDALDEHGIPWEIVPGVPAYAAAAAALRTELTVPEVAQTVILTRVDGRSTPMPEGEDLATACASGGTAVIHLAAHQAERVRDELMDVYGPNAPVAVAAFVSRPEEILVRTTLSRLPAALEKAGIRRTAVIMVGAVLDENLRSRRANPLDSTNSGGPARSFLYSDTRPRDEHGRTICDAPASTTSDTASGDTAAHDRNTAATDETEAAANAVGPAATTQASHSDTNRDLELVPDPIEAARKRGVEESELAVPEPEAVAPILRHRQGPPNKILILGGTSEARELANLCERAGLAVVTSLAGRVKRPRLPRGEVRIGGFGGPEGLGRYIYDNSIELIVDATHPFAERISDSAVKAAASTGVPLLRLHRPPWEPQPGDEWISVSDTEAAARVVQERFRRPLLTIGRQQLSAFAADARGSYLIRCVEPPEGPLPRRYLLMFDRGPFDFDDEHALLRRHRIDVVVTKNSGGGLTAAKLEAARSLHIPVVMIERPPAPPVPTVNTVAEAAQWIVDVFGTPPQ